MNDSLFPLTLTRKPEDIRIGILTIKEKTQRFDVNRLKRPWDIFRLNDQALREDFTEITRTRTSQPIPSTVQTIDPHNIFVEEGAKLSHCTLNASTGPIYIGKYTEIMEGATIRGPFALCDGAVVKMGARIYGATTVGPYSVAGGEIKNTVIFGYSNKAHDGYLGDSVIGEWCNLGAGTSNSNVKNNAGEIKIWDDSASDYLASGLLKCGLIMGDYSRAAINTSFNTGTVVGVAANIFGEGLMPKFIPSFSWGSEGERYNLNSALEHIANWKKMKGHILTEQEKSTLKLIFEQK